MKNIFCKPNLGFFIFRVFIGLSMAFGHGLGKLPPPEQLIAGVTSMGFPLPIVFAWAAALSEFIGALLITMGFYTRWAAASLGFTMAIAAFVVHGADPFKVKELALIYFISSIFFLLNGAGPYSLDKIIRKKI